MKDQIHQPYIDRPESSLRRCWHCKKAMDEYMECEHCGALSDAKPCPKCGVHCSLKGTGFGFDDDPIVLMEAIPERRWYRGHDDAFFDEWTYKPHSCELSEEELNVFRHEDDDCFAAD